MSTVHKIRTMDDHSEPGYVKMTGTLSDGKPWSFKGESNSLHTKELVKRFNRERKEDEKFMKKQRDLSEIEYRERGGHSGIGVCGPDEELVKAHRTNHGESTVRSYCRKRRNR